MVICSQCGHETQSNDHFCQACGQQLEESFERIELGEMPPLPVASATDSGGWQQVPAGAFSSGDSLLGATAAQSSPIAHNSPVSTAVVVGRLVVRSTAEGGDSDNQGEQEYVLDERDVAIGRAPSCDVVLNGDQLASRRHALLRNKGRHFSIVDLGSSNGTYVNDLEIREETVLHDGDCVKIGGHELLFSTGPASPQASYAGGQLSGPLPHSQLTETSPSISSIQMPSLLSDVPEEISAADAAFVVAPAAEPTAGEEFPIAYETSDVRAATVETLRAQLAEVTAALAHLADTSDAVAQQVDSESRAIELLRATITDARDRLADVVDALPSERPADVSGDVGELITIARQAADNPRHLDYLTTLASHASEIADTLAASQSRANSQESAEIRATLEEIRGRLDDALS